MTQLETSTLRSNVHFVRLPGRHYAALSEGAR